jgi:excisionase family DNA binding protein
MLMRQRIPSKSQEAIFRRVFVYAQSSALKQEENAMKTDHRLTYTVEETAELIGVSLSAAYKCIRRGELPCLHMGRRVLVPRRALELMLGNPQEKPLELDRLPDHRGFNPDHTVFNLDQAGQQIH